MINDSKKETEKLTDTYHSDDGMTDRPGLSPVIQEDIGRRLRSLYGQMAAEPLPDRFVKLLDQLSSSEVPTEHLKQDSKSLGESDQGESDH